MEDGQQRPSTVDNAPSGTNIRELGAAGENIVGGMGASPLNLVTMGVVGGTAIEVSWCGGWSG